MLRGNNDDPHAGAANGWTSIGDYAEIEVDDHKLVLGHYPFRSWNQQHRGSINLHGHSHGKLKPMSRQFDVGVDARGFRPVTLTSLLTVIPTLPIGQTSGRSLMKVGSTE